MSGSDGKPLVAGARGAPAAILTIFFASGACGLVYETVWQKMLCLVFGITTYATATILSAFMGGLALGSYLFGRYADRTARPLRVYAALEAAVGAFALVFPAIASGLMVTFAWIAVRFEPAPGTIAVIRFLLCAAVLAIPAALMGGTLPLISRSYVRRLDRVGSAAGALYGINTLGGVAGCFLAGFVLMPSIGTRATLWGAAAVNLALAALAYAIDRREPAASTTAEPEARDAGSDARTPAGWMPDARTMRLLYYGSAVSGFCALAYEVLWTRSVSFFFPSSLYAFPTMLTSFLLGSAIGSLLYARYFERARRPVLLLGMLQLAIGAAAFLTLFEFSALGGIYGLLTRRFGRGWSAFAGPGIVVSALVMVVPCILMGIAFPAIAKAFTRSLSGLGRSIGSLYSANTVGCVAGSVLAGFAIAPAFGVVKGIALVAGVNVVLGTLFLLANVTRLPARLATLLAGAALIGGVAHSAAGWKVPPVLYGKKFSRLFTEGDRILYFGESVDGTITVTEMGEHPYDGVRYRDIEVDGVSVAGDPPVLRTTQKVQGHIPLLLFKASTGRDAERAFILGLGSGEASSCIAKHGVKAVDCGELVAAEVGANHFFSHVNHGILKNPKFNLILNDARNHMLTTPRTDDVMQSDSVHPTIAFNTYTKEYYELCRKHLSDRGVFSTWIPIYGFTEDQMKTLVNTMLAVFPHVSIWWAPNFQNKHAILIGTNHPISIDYAAFKAEATLPEIRRSLAEIDLDSLDDLLGTFVADETTLREWAAGAPVNTDDNLLLAFGIPKNTRIGDETVPENLDAFARMGRSIVPYLHGLSDDERQAIGIDAHDQARANVLRAMSAYYRAKTGGPASLYAESIREYEEALRIDPVAPAVRRLYDEMRFFQARAAAEEHTAAGRFDLALAEYNRSLSIRPGNPWALNGVAICHAALGNADDAAAALRQALEAAPGFAVARTNLALYYWKVGDKEAARRELRISLEQNPFDVETNRVAGLMGVR